MDVTEQHENQERLQMLMREVDHRANNLLAVVQGVVALSQGDDVEALRQVLTGRVDALARAHQLLAGGRWAGADLRRLVEEELRPYGIGEEARVHIAGSPDVSLTPAQAQALALALHELATNAAKHGALHAAKGEVHLAWSVTGGTLLMSWRELGGPPVDRPKTFGFGTTVLARALGGALGGNVDLQWAPDGLQAQLILPLRQSTDAP